VNDTVCKGLVNGKTGFPEPPEPIDTKLDMSDFVGDLIPHAKFGCTCPYGGGATYA